MRILSLNTPYSFFPSSTLGFALFVLLERCWLDHSVLPWLFDLEHWACALMVCWMVFRLGLGYTSLVHFAVGGFVDGVGSVGSSLNHHLRTVPAPDFVVTM